MQLITQMENVSTILMAIRFSLMVWVLGLANKKKNVINLCRKNNNNKGAFNNYVDEMMGEGVKK